MINAQWHQISWTDKKKKKKGDVTNEIQGDDVIIWVFWVDPRVVPLRKSHSKWYYFQIK